MELLKNQIGHQNHTFQQIQQLLIEIIQQTHLTL
jgi:hypothetical protein